MRSVAATLFTVLLVAACGGRPAAGPPAATLRPAPVGLETAAATITPQDMYDRIAFLACDELAGRNTPSPGLEKAAEYIAREFAAMGLEPAGDSGTFIQRWPYHQTRLDPARTTVSVRNGATTETWRVGSDFFVLPGQRESTAGELLFAGTAVPGLRLGENARGKIVALYMPGAMPDASWNNAIGAAFGAALPAGATAVVLILDPGLDDGLIGQIAEQGGTQQAPLPIVGVRYATARTLFAAAGHDLDALRAQDAAALPLTGVVATITTGRNSVDSRPPNVAGMIRGSDPVLRDEYIVFSAHMDHVGTGPPDAAGDSIFNGADDDASGTATIMEVAQAFAALPAPPRRSVLFLAVSGEEKGLLGSRYFADYPTVPRGQIVANINLDMVGRNAPDTVVAIGQDYSSLGPTAQQIARARPELRLVVAPDLWPQEQLFFRSDHYSFAQKGIPALFFTTGLHDQYHKQSDHVDLIDTDKITRIGRLVFYLGHEIASADGKPEWTEKGRAAVGGPAGR